MLAALVLGLAVLGLGPPAAQASQTPANGMISFGKFDPALGDMSLWVANSNGTGQRRLVTGISNFSDWSPDGRRIAFDFIDDAGVHIASISPHGGSPQQITFGSGIQEVPKWSPDGQWIVFDASPVSPDDPTFQTSIWLI